MAAVEAHRASEQLLHRMDGRAQEELAAQLDGLVKFRLEQMSTTVAAYLSSGLEAAQQKIKEHAGGEVSEEIDNIVREMSFGHWQQGRLAPVVGVGNGFAHRV